MAGPATDPPLPARLPLLASRLHLCRTGAPCAPAALRPVFLLGGERGPDLQGHRREFGGFRSGWWSLSRSPRR